MTTFIQKKPRWAQLARHDRPNSDSAQEELSIIANNKGRHDRAKAQHRIGMIEHSKAGNNWVQTQQGIDTTESKNNNVYIYKVLSVFNKLMTDDIEKVNQQQEWKHSIIVSITL